MHVALSLVALVGVVVAVVAGCRRIDAPAPLVLVAVGAAASFLPFVPEVHLSSEVVLVGLLPPLLYSTALQTSLVDFNTNRRPILLLSIGLIVVTTVGVGALVHAVVPGIRWPAALALGAVVAPPDAVAATAIGRRIGLPRRIVTILEGESLLNDATALVALRMSILATTTAVSAVQVGVDFVIAAAGGLVVGVGLYAVLGWVRKHVTDPVLDTSVSLVTPFLAYVLAEQIHASGVLAVVITGLLLGHRSPVLLTASSRIAERLNWRTISFLLENAVFLLIGLQARWIFAAVARGNVPVRVVVLACLSTFAAVTVIRLVYVFPVRFLLVRPGADNETGQHPSWRDTLVVGWAGMRGVVTLAAAFAIPDSVRYREVLILVALFVTAATLFVQGLSLPWLVRRLRLRAPDAREDALARAALFQQASVAGLERLDEHVDEDDPFDTVAALRRRAEQRDTAAWERLGGTSPEEETPSEAYARLRLEMLEAERERVLALRRTGQIPHEVIEDVLIALDVEESMLDVHNERREDLDEADMVSGVVGTVNRCEHLDRARGEVRSRTSEHACEDCVREGRTAWVHLRLCLTCGHLGCCDSSPRRHASAHFAESEHPVMQSAEPSEDWRWCFVDDLLG